MAHGWSVVQQLDARLARTEDRLNKAGIAREDATSAEPDGSSEPTDARSSRPPTDTASRAWSKQHVLGRSKRCEVLCQADAECRERCSTQYNLCGIKCTADPANACFAKCIDGIGARGSD